MLLYPFVALLSGSALEVALHSKGLIKDLLAHRWIIYLGKISFGLYVFHNLCFTVMDYLLRLFSVDIVGMNILLALLVTIATAALSYEFFEKKFLRLKRKYTTIDSKPL
jgi:peptidoglycan/LPS O-acetylase OafA/YrhL